MSVSIHQTLRGQPDGPASRVRLDELVAQVSRSVTARLARDTGDREDLPATVDAMVRDAIASFGQAEIMAGRAPLAGPDSTTVARRVRDAVLGLGRCRRSSPRTTSTTWS